MAVVVTTTILVPRRPQIQVVPQIHVAPQIQVAPQLYVVLSASFCAKDLLKVAWCQYLEILRAKRRAQDDADRRSDVDP